MYFKLGRHPGRPDDTEAVEVYDDEGNCIAGICPSLDGKTLRIVTEFIRNKEAVRVYMEPPSVEALEAAAEESGISAEELAQAHKTSGLGWPSSIDINFDLSIGKERWS
jgi:hypothetical protein